MGCNQLCLHVGMNTTTYCECILLDITFCWQLPSNQGFYREIVGYGMSAPHTHTGMSSTSLDLAKVMDALTLAGVFRVALYYVCMCIPKNCPDMVIQTHITPANGEAVSYDLRLDNKEYRLARTAVGHDKHKQHTHNGFWCYNNYYNTIIFRTHQILCIFRSSNYCSNSVYTACMLI